MAASVDPSPELQRLRLLLAGQSALTALTIQTLQAVLLAVAEDAAIAAGPLGIRLEVIVAEWDMAYKSVWQETDAGTEGGLSALANTDQAAASPAPILVQ